MPRLPRDAVALMPDVRATSSGELPDHLVEPCAVGHAQALSGQQASQQVASAVRWQSGKRSAAQTASISPGGSVQIGEFIGQLSRLGGMPGQASQRRRGLRHGRLKQRQDLVTQQIASQSGVGVARVLDPVQALTARPVLERGARHVNEGTQEQPPARLACRRDAGQSSQAGAAKRIEQHRLRLVLAMMRKQDRICGELVSRTGQRCMSHLSSRGLRTLATDTFNVDTLQYEGGAEPGSDPPAMSGPIVRIGVQAMVYVDHERRTGTEIASHGTRRMQQYRGIETTAEADCQPRVAARQGRIVQRVEDRLVRAAVQPSVSLNRP